MGKIPESTSFKISDFIFRFRESSQRLVVEILTQNFAFNLSGTLFFIGLGYSLKWWYKDQLLITLLKQNLPAFSQPQQKISWETGEYLIGEQTRQFLKKNNEIVMQPNCKEVGLKKSEMDFLLTPQVQNNSPCSFNDLIDRVDVYSNSVVINFRSPWQKHAYHRFVGLFPELICADTRHTSSMPVRRLPSNLGFSEANASYLPLRVCIKDSETVSHDAPAVVKRRRGIQKENIFSAANSLDKCKKSTGNSSTKFVHSVSQKKKYTFWGPPKNWFKLSARGLCILNDASLSSCTFSDSAISLPASSPTLRFSDVPQAHTKMFGVLHESTLRRFATFFRKPLIQTLEFPFNAVCEIPEKKTIEEKENVFAEHEVHLCTFAPKVHRASCKDVSLPLILNKGLAELSLIVNNGFVVNGINSGTCNQYIEDVKKKDALAHAPEVQVQQEMQSRVTFPQSLVRRRFDNMSPVFSKIANGKLSKQPTNLSYPLELTQKMSGWQPPVQKIILNSYLDEIPYKLENTLWATTRQIDNHKLGLSNSNGPLRQYSGDVKNKDQTLHRFTKSKKQLDKGYRLAGMDSLIREKEERSGCSDLSLSPQPLLQGKKNSETAKQVVKGGAPQVQRRFTTCISDASAPNFDQYIEIKQLLLNELQILVNSLPVIFVDRSSRSESNNRANNVKAHIRDAQRKDTWLTPNSNSLHDWFTFDTEQIGSCDSNALSFSSANLDSTVSLSSMPTTRVHEFDRHKEEKSTQQKASHEYAKETEKMQSSFVSKEKNTVFDVLDIEESTKYISDVEPPLSGSQIHFTAGSALKMHSYASLNSFSLLNSLGITFNNLSYLKDPPVLLPINQDASFWKWNRRASKMQRSVGVKMSSSFLSLLGQYTPDVSLLAPAMSASCKATVHRSETAKQKKSLRFLNLGLSSFAKQDRSNIVTDTTFRFDPNTMTWQVLQQLNNPAMHKISRSAKRVHFINQIKLQQKKSSFFALVSNKEHSSPFSFTTHVPSVHVSETDTAKCRRSPSVDLISPHDSELKSKGYSRSGNGELRKIENINPVDTQVSLKNKRVRLMSGYIYPDTQSTSLMSNFYRWTSSESPLGRTCTSSGVIRSASPGVFSPITLTDKQVGEKSEKTFAHLDGKNTVSFCKGGNDVNKVVASSKRVKKADLSEIDGDKNFTPRAFAPAVSDSLACTEGSVTSEEMHVQPNCLLYSKKFRKINRLGDNACLFKVCTSGTPTKIGCLSWVQNARCTKNGQQPVLSISPNDSECGENRVEQWNFDHHLGLFPGFRKPNQFILSLNQISQGNNLSEDLFTHFYDVSLNSNSNTSATVWSGKKYGVINSVEGVNEIKQNLTQNKKGASSQPFDCSTRKTAYNGIVVQRNPLTKDFQLSKKRLKRHSILGTFLFGPENPFTNRQSHFFGQRRLSTVDVNAFQRDYLRQLGRETLLQSNPKEFTYGASVERVKILSFSKAINSFLSKKRKYTYLLEEKDQWHLLFQEQLRTALEDTRKYPPLTPEESKDRSPGRIKVSAPLMMARFPRKSNCHKVLAHYNELLYNGHRNLQSPLDASAQCNQILMPCTEGAKEIGCKDVSLLAWCTREADNQIFDLKEDATSELSKEMQTKQTPQMQLVKRRRCTPAFLKENSETSNMFHYRTVDNAIFTETHSSQHNSAPLLEKSEFAFGNNNLAVFLGQQWFTQEPLNANSWLIISQWSFLVALLFWIEQTFLADIFPALFALEQLLLGATGMKSDDRTHVTRVSKGEIPKFKDIAGIDGLLGELAELVLFLRGHKKRLWNKRSAFGVLLTGPPGTGKTFLVRALANEAKVPVLILSAGVLTANKTNNSKPSWSIRHAFRRAKQLAPCILFIDEIDALGRSRGNIVTDINEIVASAPGSRNIQATPLSNSSFFEMKNSFQLYLPFMQPSCSEKATIANTSLQQQLLSATETQVHQIQGTKSLRELASQGKSISAYNQIDRYSLCADTSWLINASFFGHKSSSLGSETKIRLAKLNDREGDKTLFTSDAHSSHQPVQSMQTKENIKRKFGPLTQLLVSMDGVSSLAGVLIIGATNRPESLDPALTRPGRFERIIRVEKPAEQKRIEILKLYSRNLGIQKQIPWSYLANRTVGLTAADLAVAMNYSSLKAILQGTMHTTETIEYGLDSIARFSSREVNQTKSVINKKSTENVSPLENSNSRASSPTLRFFDVPQDVSLRRTDEMLQVHDVTHQKELIEKTNYDRFKAQWIYKGCIEAQSNQSICTAGNRECITHKQGTEEGVRRRGCLVPTRTLSFATHIPALHIHALASACTSELGAPQVQSASPTFHDCASRRTEEKIVKQQSNPLQVHNEQVSAIKQSGVGDISRSIIITGSCISDALPSPSTSNFFSLTTKTNKIEKKRLQRLTQIAYYQSGKIVVQTLLPLHPPVALITLNLSGTTTATSADTYIPIDDELNTYWSSFLESRLMGLYGGKASSLLVNRQHLLSIFSEKPKSGYSRSGDHISDFLPSDKPHKVSEAKRHIHGVDYRLPCIESAFSTTSFAIDPLRRFTKSKTYLTESAKKAKRRRYLDSRSGLELRSRSSLDAAQIGKMLQGGNLFQSNIGTEEIQTATFLAVAMVNRWALSFSCTREAEMYIKDVPPSSETSFFTSLMYHLSFAKRTHALAPPVHVQVVKRLDTKDASRFDCMDSLNLPKGNSTKTGDNSNAPDYQFRWGKKWVNKVGDYPKSGKKKEFTRVSLCTKDTNLMNNLFSTLGAQYKLNKQAPNTVVCAPQVQRSVGGNQCQPFSRDCSASFLCTPDSAISLSSLPRRLSKINDEPIAPPSPMRELGCIEDVLDLGRKVMKMSEKSKKFVSAFTISLISKADAKNCTYLNGVNSSLLYSPGRFSIENVATTIPLRTHVFQLVNPLQFSVSQRDRFYPGWFRLYLPEIEATEFMKNVANYYYSQGLQTLTRSSLIFDQTGAVDTENPIFLVSSFSKKNRIKKVRFSADCTYGAPRHKIISDKKTPLDRLDNIENLARASCTTFSVPRQKKLETTCSLGCIPSALQKLPFDYNDVSFLEKELIYHSLVNNCFSKSLFLIDQNRQLTDYFADYLVRFQILRQHQILYLFSTVLFNCKKQT